MNLWKKATFGVSAVAFAAVLAAGANVKSAEAAATNIAPGLISVDYANQLMKINETSGTKDTKFYVSVATVSVKKTKVEDTVNETYSVKLKAATEYDAKTAGVATIDLASYAVTKDLYLSVRGNKNENAILLKIPAAKTKIKAAVDPALCQVEIQDITIKKEPKPLTDKIEYCTSNGSWAEYTKGKTDLTSHQVLGATLRFRVKASAATVFSKTDTKLPAADGSSISFYANTGNYASNELKVKIAKTANGPKATFDYAKHTIKVANTAEYRVMANNAANLPAAYTEVPDDPNPKIKTTTLSADTIFDSVKDVDCNFDIRTAAIDKKPASKITEYNLSAIDRSLKGFVKSSSKYVAAGTGTDITKSVFGTPNATGWSNPEIGSATVSLNKKKQIVVSYTNKTDNVYEVVVSDGNAVPAHDAKITAKIAAQTTVKKTGEKVEKTTSITLKKDGQFVFMRKAANAKTGEWSTPFTLMGVVVAPAE